MKSEKKLVAYITTKLPSNSFTIDLSLNMAQNGVNIIELGVPFSDSVADGPIIEKANHLALSKNVKFKDIKVVTQAIAPTIETFWMGYFNSFYHQGMEKLLPEAKKLALKGLIIPDLPHEEAIAYTKLFNTHNLANIVFVAPTSSDKRIQTIVKDAKQFIYLVSYAGITGKDQNEPLNQIMTSIKRYSATPIFVGFGVNEKTAKEKVKGANGVIVGSAFIKILLQDNLTLTQKIKNISLLAKEIKEKINE